MFFVCPERSKMAKTSRTYRLTDEAIQAIEERDKIQYETAGDYVEQAIKAMAANSSLEEKRKQNFFKEFQIVKADVEEIKELLISMKKQSLEESLPI